MSKNKESVVVKVVELNNKSRKGKYLYIKMVGSPSRYYKYDDKSKEGLIDYYLLRYGSDYVPLKKKENYKRTQAKKKRLAKIKNKYDSPREYAIALRSKPKIKTAFKKGISKWIIYDMFELGYDKINEVYMNLFKPLIHDKDLLKIVAKEDNVQKVKHRFEYVIELRNKNGERVAGMSHIGKKTLVEIKNDLDNVKKLNTKFTSDVGRLFKGKGYNVDMYKKDVVNTMYVEVLYRRG